MSTRNQTAKNIASEEPSTSQQQRQDIQTDPLAQPTQQIDLNNSNTQNVSNLRTELRQADEEDRIRNLVTVLVQGRQASLLEELENNLSGRIEARIESTLTQLVQQMNLNLNPLPQNNVQPSVNATRVNTPPVEQINPHCPHDMPNLDSPLNVHQFNKNIDNLRLSDHSVGPNTRHIAQLIKSWDITFDGSPRLSVESFLYRLETQVIDTLGGNFNILCEPLQSLLAKDAKDWYWSYRKSVRRITRPGFCEAIQKNFEEHKTDTEINPLRTDP